MCPWLPGLQKFELFFGYTVTLHRLRYAPPPTTRVAAKAPPETHNLQHHKHQRKSTIRYTKSTSHHAEDGIIINSRNRVVKWNKRNEACDQNVFQKATVGLWDCSDADRCAMKTTTSGLRGAIYQHQSMNAILELQLGRLPHIMHSFSGILAITITIRPTRLKFHWFDPQQIDQWNSSRGKMSEDPHNVLTVAAKPLISVDWVCCVAAYRSVIMWQEENRWSLISISAVLTGYQVVWTSRSRRVSPVRKSTDCVTRASCRVTDRQTDRLADWWHPRHSLHANLSRSLKVHSHRMRCEWILTPSAS